MQDNENLIIELATSPFFLISLFLGLTLIFHCLIIFVKNPNDLFWKKVDYYWLSLTIIGLFSASSNLEKKHAEQLLKYQALPGLEAAYHRLYEFFEYRASDESWYCINIDTKYEKTFFTSKEDFELGTQKLIQQCNFFKTEFKNIPKNLPKPYISSEDLGLPKALVADYSDVKYYNLFLQDYDKQFSLYKNLEDKQDLSSNEILVMFFSPFFICFGLALRMTKVTGDIMNAKKKAK